MYVLWILLRLHHNENDEYMQLKTVFDGISGFIAFYYILSHNSSFNILGNKSLIYKFLEMIYFRDKICLILHTLIRWTGKQRIRVLVG